MTAISIHQYLEWLQTYSTPIDKSIPPSMESVLNALEKQQSTKTAVSGVSRVGRRSAHENPKS